MAYTPLKLDGIEIINIFNKDGEQTIATTGDQGIVVSGKIQGTELEGTSLDINGSADISGSLTGLNGSLTTTANYFQLNTPSGYIQIGAMNTSHAHIYTDRASFYTNKPILVSGDTVLTSASGVMLSGTQTITGVKNFSAEILFDAGFKSDSILLNGAQNFDDISRSGFYNLYNTQTSSTNSPPLTYGTMIVVGGNKQNSSFGLQIAHERTGTGMYVRGMNDTASAWSAWAEIWTSTTDGPGSGLDADKLDSQDSGYYLNYNNFTNKPTIPTDFVSAANGGTFSGDIQSTGIYVGSTNTSYDFYNNGTSYLNGATTVDDNLNVHGNILLTGTATTSNQTRMIDFTGFDKEGTGDFSDRAYIAHTTNTGGHAGSVLVISAQNDANDGIAFATNASAPLKWNTHEIWTAGNDGSGSGLDADTVDGQHASALVTPSWVPSSDPGYFKQGSYSAGYTGDMDSLTGFRIIRSTSGSNRAFSSHHNVITIPNTGSSQYGAQLAFETGTVSDGGIKFRSSTNGTFTSWYRLYHEGHLPTLSELGAQAAGSYAAASHSHTNVTNGTDNITVGSATWSYNNGEANVAGQVYDGGTGDARFMFHSGNGKVNVYTDGQFYANEGAHLVWNTGNDGAGSGLDADKLDGQQGSHYLAYGNLTGVPSTFAPRDHTQAFSTISNTPTTLSGYGITDASALKSGTVSSVSNAGFTTAFKVENGGLASHIVVSVQGTTGNVVVSNIIHINVNHSQDMMIEGLNGVYTLLTVKVVSDNNENFAVQFKTNSANAVTLYLEVHAYGNEVITFTNTHSFTGNSVESTLNPGKTVRGSGGNNGDIRTAGIFYGGGLYVGNLGMSIEAQPISIGSTGDLNSASWAQNTSLGGLTLKTQSGVEAGSYTNANITVNSKGIISAVSSGSSGSNVVLSSSSNGTIGNLVGGSYGQQLEKGSTAVATLRSDADRWRIYAGAGSGEVFTVEQTGKVGIKDSSPDYPLDVNHNVSGISIYASHDIAAYSDERVKKDIETIPDALDKVSKLRGVTFKRTDEGSSDKTHMGVIAQEIQEIIPEVVTERPSDGHLSVSYGNVVGVLIEAIKELKAEVEELKGVDKCKCKN